MNQEKHNALMKRLPSETSAFSQKNIDIAIGEATKQQIDKAISCYKNGARLINQNIDMLQRDIEHVNKTSAMLQEMKNRNRVLAGEYNNEPELKGDLTEALDCSVAASCLSGDIEKCDEQFANIDGEIKEARQDSLDEIEKSIKAKFVVTKTDRSYSKQYVLSTYGKAKRTMIILAWVFVLLVPGFIIAGNTCWSQASEYEPLMEKYWSWANASVNRFDIYMSSYYMYSNMHNVWRGVSIACIVLAVVAAIMFIVFLSRGIRYSYTIETETDMLIQRWTKAADNYLQQKIKAIEYSKIDMIYKSLAETSGNKVLAASVDEDLIPTIQQYEEAKNNYLALRNDSKIMDKLCNEIDNICSDFLNVVSPEFRDYDKLSDICDLLKAKRADTLKEAYTILEVRYREDARDEELRKFHRIQNEEAIAQTQAQLLTAKITQQNGEVQAYYAKRQTEYAAQTAQNTREAAENTRQTANNTRRIGKSMAKYAEDYEKNSAETRDYAAKIAKYGESTSSSAGKSADELKKIRKGLFGDDE